MDASPPSRSSSAAWAAAFVVLPLVYGLSIGPVIYLAEKFHVKSTVEPAAKVFYLPLIWAHDHTPLKGPLEACEKGCRDMARGR